MTAAFDISERLAKTAVAAAPLTSLRLTGMGIQADCLSVILEALSRRSCIQEFCLLSSYLDLPVPDILPWCRHLSMCTSLTALKIQSRHWISDSTPPEVGLTPFCDALGRLTSLTRLSFCQEYENTNEVVVYSALSTLRNLSQLRVSTWRGVFLDRLSCRAIASFLESSPPLFRELSVGTLSAACSQEIADFGSALANVSLSKLKLTVHGLLEEASATLAAALSNTTAFSSVAALSFKGQGSNLPVYLHPILRALAKDPTSQLKQIQFKSFFIAQPALEALAAMAQIPSRKYEFLFEASSINDAPLRRFFGKLGAAPGLVRLEFNADYFNEICDNFCRFISSTQHLKYLRLRVLHDEDSEETACAVAAALASNSSIVDLQMRFYMDSSRSCLALAEMVKKNCTLTSLSLGSYQDTHPDGIEILRALKFNSSILRLEMRQLVSVSAEDAPELDLLCSSDWSLARGIKLTDY